MDDDDFDDLLAGVDLLEGSSQESLTDAAAHLRFDDSNNRDGLELKASAELPVAIEKDHGLSVTVSSPIFNVAGESSLSPLHKCVAINQRQTTSPMVESSVLTVVEKIEAVFENIADALLQKKQQLTITLKMRQKPQIGTLLSINNEDTEPVSAKTRSLCFPGKTAEEAWRFTVVTRILELIHGALRDDLVLSKRDIYYRDPALFGSQGTVDRYVDHIAFTFCVPRSKLNVTAVAKGLVAGAVRFCRRDGSTTDAANDREGILVPSLRDLLSVAMVSVKWILIIEKEATFRSIAASSFWDVASTHGVIITGKGYPDIATRALLRFLSTPSPFNGFSSPPVHGLVDCDPDGLAILSIYRDGSEALSHENPELCVPQLQWLGLRVEHMMVAVDDVHASQGLLPLTARDRRKALKMIERCVTSEDDDDSFQLRQALQTMLMLNIKAELQLLDAAPDGMANLLASGLGNT